MTEPVPGVRPADSPNRPVGYALDLVLIEESVPGGGGKWFIAGAGLRDGDKEWWLGESPGGSFQYWWEKAGNGYNSIVSQYYVHDEVAATKLVELRKQELAAGCTPLGEFPLSAQTEDVPRPDPSSPDSVGRLEEPEGDRQPDDHHEYGRELSMPHAMSSAMVWRLAAELVRRHPDRLWVYAEGGVVYDRVTVVDVSLDRPTPLLTMNAAGANSLLVRSRALLPWADAVAYGADRAAWVRQVEGLCGLPTPPKPLPASTVMSLVPRFVAIFLLTQLGSRSDWRAESIFALDQARGWHRGMATEWARTHPGRLPEMVFLSREGEPEPEFGLTSSGELRRRDGSRMMLTEKHRSGAPIVRLLIETVPDLLP